MKSIAQSVYYSNQLIKSDEPQNQSASEVMWFNQLPEKIESERLIIRVARPGDGKLLNEAVIDSSEHLKGWVPWVTPLPSIDDSEHTCQRAYDNFLKNKDLMVLFFSKNDGSLIGGSGLHNIDWERRYFKVGYWGHSKYVGKGLITEGVKTLVNYAFINLNAKRVYLNIDTTNINSCKLAERVGFKLESTIDSDKLDLNGKQRIINVYALEALIVDK